MEGVASNEFDDLIPEQEGEHVVQRFGRRVSAQDFDDVRDGPGNFQEAKDSQYELVPEHHRRDFIVEEHGVFGFEEAGSISGIQDEVTRHFEGAVWFEMRLESGPPSPEGRRTRSCAAQWAEGKRFTWESQVQSIVSPSDPMCSPLRASRS